MRRMLVWAGAVFVASACSFIVNFNPEGQICDAAGACLAGYVCVDGACVTRANADAGVAAFEAFLSGTQVDPQTWDDRFFGSGSFEYEYGTNTLRWSIEHNADHAVSADLHVGHPGWSGPTWQDLRSAESPITGSTTVTDDAEAALIQKLTRGHLYVALFDQYKYEIIRGYIVEPGGRIYVTPLYDPAWNPIARAGLVASSDAGTLYYDVTLNAASDVADAGVTDGLGSILVGTPWTPIEPTRCSGAVPLPDHVFRLLETNKTSYRLYNSLQLEQAVGYPTKVK